MIFLPTPLGGVFVIQPELSNDNRGSFARTFCRREFETRSLNPTLAQCSISFNLKKGTLRGLHYQMRPNAEAKLVRCTRGAIFDVALDLRPGSATYRQWTSVELSEDNRLALYIPEGCAHGFQTLTDNTEVLYQISEYYQPESSRGVRWNDPAIGISWPLSDPVVSERDRSFPLLGNQNR